MKNRTHPKKVIKLCKADRKLIGEVLKIGEDGDTADTILPLKGLSPAGRIALSNASIDQIYFTALDVLPAATQVAAKGVLLFDGEKRRKAKRVCSEVRDMLRLKNISVEAAV